MHADTKNQFCWEFLNSIPPAEWSSKEAKLIYDTAIEAEKNGKWEKHIISGSIKLDILPDRNGPFSPNGTKPEDAAKKALKYATALENEAAEIRKRVAISEGNHYIVPLEKIHAPTHPFDAEKQINWLIKDSAIRAIWVHGVKFVRGTETRTFRKAEE